MTVPPISPTACACDGCKRAVTVQLMLSKLPEDQREFWDGIYTDLLHAEMDRDVNMAILEGSWPDADLVQQGIREQYEAAVARESLG